MDMEIEHRTSPADAESRALVRSFSDKLRAENDTPTVLEQALDHDQHDRRRRELFESSAQQGRSFDRASRECETIRQAWPAFLLDLDSDIDTKSKTPWKGRNKTARIDAELKELKVSTREDVLAELDTVQKSWIEKDRVLGGKCQEYFHRACNALSEHDIIFDTIPSQNNYAATLCGSMRMLIRASSNHVKYAEELGRALSEISDELGQANILLAVMYVPEMERRVEELYIKIFHMFRRAMIWYQSNAFRKIRFGLNEGLYDKLKDDVLAIKGHAFLIHRDAVARNIVEARESRLIGEATYSRLSEVQRTQDATFVLMYQMYQQMAQEREERQRDKAERQRDEAKRQQELITLFSEVGRLLGNGLNDKALQHVLDNAFTERRASQTARITENDRSAEYQEDMPQSPSSSRHTLQYEAVKEARTQRSIPYYRDDLTKASENLDAFITGLDKWNSALRKVPRLTTPVVASKMQAWSRASNCQRLWIFGPPNYGVPSALVRAAVSVLKTSQFLQIPVVAHSCDRGRASSEFLSREEQGMIGLVYSMIRQLAASYPDGMQTHLDLSAKRFERLDGSLESWQDALDVLADLIACAPPLLLCLIDGLNRVEGGTAIRMCEDFLDVLNTYTDPDPDQERVCKLLFTSSGNCKTLRDWLDKQELCMVEDAPPARQSSNNLGDGTTPLVLRDVFDGTEDDD